MPSVPNMGTVRRMARSEVLGRVSRGVVRQFRSMGAEADSKYRVKPGNSDRSNSCAHFRWGITSCRRPMSAMPR